MQDLLKDGKINLESLFSIFNELPYRVYIRDINKKIVYANKLIEDLLGKRREEVIGLEYNKVFKDERLIKLLETHDKAFKKVNLGSFSSIHEHNQCYKKPSVMKIIDFSYTDPTQKEYLITMMIELEDFYCKEKTLELCGIGAYDPANRLIYLKNNQTVCLTRLENSFLFLLFEKKYNKVNYDEIFACLDIYNTMTKDSLKALVYRLKKKLNKNIIENISMEGYKLIRVDE